MTRIVVMALIGLTAAWACVGGNVMAAARRAARRIKLPESEKVNDEKDSPEDNYAGRSAGRPGGRRRGGSHRRWWRVRPGRRQFLPRVGLGVRLAGRVTRVLHRDPRCPAQVH